MKLNKEYLKCLSHYANLIIIVMPSLLQTVSAFGLEASLQANITLAAGIAVSFAQAITFIDKKAG